MTKIQKQGGCVLHFMRGGGRRCNDVTSMCLNKGLALRSDSMAARSDRSQVRNPPAPQWPNYSCCSCYSMLFSITTIPNGLVDEPLGAQDGRGRAGGDRRNLLSPCPCPCLCPCPFDLRVLMGLSKVCEARRSLPWCRRCSRLFFRRHRSGTVLSQLRFSDRWEIRG